ncbi:carbohydrate kinase [Terrimonas sp.]|uniref:bifunctional heptose 7-phosphate kinase/heptose 1-phosphate adenyltransferase n=1 Tax=Terrimonas sp. TaxID=1914338 RepID=UPI000D523840|nr:PfkB family carbohydrate kinase [Terrimonas sp.]PVD52621.1 carbohydrate kinase [Terrimonas sp.]
MKDIHALFKSFDDIKVGIIGDVMLDSYMWGRVDRISPEAPVPVVAINKKELRIGGAGNVALNICALGAKASIIAVAGNDDDGMALKKMFDENAIDTSFLLQSSKRITTNKIRVIARNQQMMRLDNELTTDLGYEDENRLILAVQHYIAQEKPQVIILEDYNKGVLTELVIQKVIDLCRHNNIIVAVDPKRKNFFNYRNVDIFKPNFKEAVEGLNLISTEINEGLLKEIHQQLHEKLQHDISFITLSEKGVFYQQYTNAAIIPSHIRNVADVSGAGDTVIAVASLVYAATKDVKLMAEIANIAGGLVCEEVGTAAIDKGKLLKECGALLVS